jgi:hypothetical protein
MLLFGPKLRVLLLIAFVLAGFLGTVACHDCGHDDETASAMPDGCHCLCHQADPLQTIAATYSATRLPDGGNSIELHQIVPSGPCPEIERPPQIV